MNPSWKKFLSQQGARFENHTVTDFGEPAAERRAALGAGVICDLSHRALIAVEGEDAFSFLQGQLTCDMNEIRADRSRLAAWCSPKGRVLALFRILRSDSGFLLELARAQLDSTLPRLKMYVLRAKVALEPVSDHYVQLGLAGESAPDLIATRYGPAPPLPDQMATNGDTRIIRLRGEPARFQFIGAPAEAKALWESAAGVLTPAGSAAWSLLNILAGVPEEVGADEHLPQMINLDVLEGLSFTKGCYVGQEIIARTHHLGRLKRRMYLIESANGDPPAPGAPIVEAPGGSEAGSIVSSAPRGESDGFAALAVLRIDAAKSGALRLGSAGGPSLEQLVLPYTVAGDAE